MKVYIVLGGAYDETDVVSVHARRADAEADRAERQADAEERWRKSRVGCQEHYRVEEYELDGNRR